MSTEVDEDMPQPQCFNTSAKYFRVFFLLGMT